MGSIATGLYDLFAGDPTKHEQNQLGALAGYDTTTGEGLTTSGANFEEAILSGDPTKISQALAPEISAGQQQVQQMKDQTAQFAPRSGGTAASTANAETAERGNLINLVGGLQSGTAGAAVGQGSNLLNAASANTLDEANLAAKDQQRIGTDVGGIAQGAAEIAAGGFGGGDIGGAADAGGGGFGGLTPEGGDYNAGYAATTGFAPTGFFNEAGDYI